MEGNWHGRAATRPWLLTVVIAAVAILGLPSPAQATTDGLRLVTTQLGSGGTYNVEMFDGDLPARQVPLGSGPVSLSPDGSTIAYTPYYDNRYHLAIADIFGNHQETLYSPPDRGPSNSDWNYVANPEWSPDGQTLIFECSSAVSAYHSICAINRTGLGFRYVVDPGNVKLMDPSYSPDGSKIAFAWGSQGSAALISVANPDGSGIRTVVDSTAMQWAREPAYGPNGQIAFHGCKPAKKKGTCDAGIYVINDNGSGLLRLTTGLEGNPNWLTGPSGPRIVFEDDYDQNSTIESIRPDGTDRRSENAWGNDPHSALNGDSASQMLQRYVPVLRYYPTETYRADSVKEITDNYLAGGTIDDTNKLQNPSGILAAANPTLGYPQLTLNYLGTLGAEGTEDQWIDERDAQAEDAQRMHGDPYYANHVYGRVLPVSGGGWIVQYWFFYYNNPKTYFGFGAHEGDWEMIQLELTTGGSPLRAAYSQHDSGEECDWIHVPRDANSRPIVYVAEGSHANYYSSGYHFNGGADDYTSDSGEQVSDSQLVDVTSVSKELWTQWRGKWGGSDSSPTGPSTQSKWTDPVLWFDTVDGCTEGQTFP